MEMGRRGFCLAGAALALGAGAGAGAGERLPATPGRGLYASGDGQLAAIGRFDEFGDGLFLFDYAAGRAGRIAGGEDGDLRVLATFSDGGEPIARLRGDGSALVKDGIAYRRIPVGRAPFALERDGITLFGETAERSDRAPHGAILLVYGSGPGPGEALDFWAFHFIARGWRVAVYDKRGSGRSGGDWRMSLEVLAADAAAVARHLRTTSPGLTLGAWGASQGGWIVPQLGAMGLAELLILHAGPAVTPAEQILGQVEAELAAYGFPAEEIARARAYYALDIDVSRGRQPWEEIDRAYRSASAAGAQWLLGPPAPAGAADRGMIGAMADFDPGPYWRASRAPALAIFGGKDVIVPPEPSRTRLRTLVPSDVPLTIELLAQANHLGFLGDSGVRAEYPGRTRIDPGYFAAIDTWTRERLASARG